MERNRRIFREQRSAHKIIWIKIKALLKECIGDQLDGAGLRDHESVWREHLDLQFTVANKSLKPLQDWQLRLSASDLMSFCLSKAHSQLFFDGAAKGNPGRSGAGGVIKNADGAMVLSYAWGVGFNTSIQAEALALLQGLKQLKTLGIPVASVFGDSQTIIKIMVDNSFPTDIRLSRLIRRIRTLSNAFQRLSFYHIKRDNNREADTEANKAVTLPPGVINSKGVESRDPIP